MKRALFYYSATGNTEKLAGDVSYPGPGPVLKEKMT
jgi:hypothetical protein